MAGTEDGAVEGAARRKYWRAAEAAVVVEAWRRSGETLSAFAARYGIRRQRLSRWAAELGEPQRPEEPVIFHPVRLVAGKRSGGWDSESIEIVTAGGYRVRVSAGFAAADLERVLRALQVVGAGC